MESYTKNGGVIGKTIDFGATDFYIPGAPANLLLPFDTDFNDSTNTVTVTNNGGVAGSTQIAKFGNSAQFSGSNWLSTTYSADLEFGLEQFTIEAWIYSPSGSNLSTNHTIICVAEGQTATNWQFNITNGYLYFYNGFGAIINSTTLIPTDQWVHVAAVREGTGTNQCKLYLNGTLWATGTDDLNYSYNVGIRVGQNRGAVAYFTGYMDEVRVVKGFAAYTSNFTPPTAPFALAGSDNKKNSGIWDLQAVYENSGSAPALPGQAEYTTAGTYSWTAPSGVTSVSVVCVGGGGAGSAYFGCGGAGGGLAYKNNITVVPGVSYTVVVGNGGAGQLDSATRGSASGSIPAANGGNSSFSNGVITVTATGGQHGFGLSATTRTLPSGGTPSGTFDGGGNGGTCAGDYSRTSWQSSGGGGAGGYSGTGGVGAGSPVSNSTLISATAGSGGGGGGGGSRKVSTSNSYGGAGGGGVGIYGEGSSGAAGLTNTTTAASSQVSTNIAGQGGSSGAGGSISTNLSIGEGGSGGFFGGGGGSGHSASSTSRGGSGQNGAVRIIWGVGRVFPSTGTADA